MRKTTPSSVALLNSGAATGKTSLRSVCWKVASTCSCTMADRSFITAGDTPFSMVNREVQDRGNSGPQLPGAKERSRKAPFRFFKSACSSLTRPRTLEMYELLGSGGTKASPSSILSASAGLKIPFKSSWLSLATSLPKPDRKLSKKARPKVTRASRDFASPLQAGRVPANCSTSVRLNWSKFKSTPCGISPRWLSWNRCGINMGRPEGPSCMPCKGDCCIAIPGTGIPGRR
mmetsp:Transcript_28188/g.66239  ORF Transcript_28188/g.66239 Transcript_28188/m.66239 type:complete len:232 (+) Transcript_28188:785-1480(+)